MGTNLNSKGMLVSSELRLDSILKDRLIVDLFFDDSSMHALVTP